jgi:nucleoside triphosphate pyrophosphatase
MGFPPLVLASASPRRRALLADVGLAFSSLAVELDEHVLPGESPRDHVVRLAGAKAREGCARFAGAPRIVLTADTTVAKNGRIFGKPADADEALGMLRALAGGEHEVLTACRLERTSDGASSAGVAVSRVRFLPWDPARARWYVGTGEPFDKAGAYGIQGRGVLLTDGIAGSWSNVVGLPLELLPSLFAAIGDDLFARITAGAREG